MPVATAPLWQLEQVPVTWVWSMCTVVQLVVTWQKSHEVDEVMCVALLPVALVPLWH